MDYKLALEYRDVALRPDHLAASALSGEEVLELIESLEGLAEPVRVMERWRPLSQDPDDDMVLELAITGRAEAIVTNKIRHFAKAKRFRIEVLSPAEMLRGLREGGKYAE
jgi:predicted nucleic acid-binding protein